MSGGFGTEPVIYHSRLVDGGRTLQEECLLKRPEGLPIEEARRRLPKEEARRMALEGKGFPVHSEVLGSEDEM